MEGEQGSQQGIRHFSLGNHNGHRGRACGARGEERRGCYFLVSRTAVLTPVTCKRMMGMWIKLCIALSIFVFHHLSWYLLRRLIIRHPRPAARAFQSSLEQHSTPSCLCFLNATPFPFSVPLINASITTCQMPVQFPLCASRGIPKRLQYGLMMDLPFKLAVALVEQPFLSVGVQNTILQGALPLVLHPLHLVIRAEDGVAVVVVIVVNLVGVVFRII